MFIFLRPQAPSAASKPPVAAVEDFGGHLGGKPVQPFNTPAVSEADYSKYQRTTTPDAKALPKPKPPTTRTKHSNRYNNNPSDSASIKSEDSSNQVVRHKQGNDILTVEIDRKEKRHSTKSLDSVDGGKMLRRRSLKNSMSAVSGSSQDREGDSRRRGSQENETSAFSGHYKRWVNFSIWELKYWSPKLISTAFIYRTIS